MGREMYGNGNEGWTTPNTHKHRNSEFGFSFDEIVQHRDVKYKIHLYRFSSIQTYSESIMSIAKHHILHIMSHIPLPMSIRVPRLIRSLIHPIIQPLSLHISPPSSPYISRLSFAHLANRARAKFHKSVLPQS